MGTILGVWRSMELVNDDGIRKKDGLLDANEDIISKIKMGESWACSILGSGGKSWSERGRS